VHRLPGLPPPARYRGPVQVPLDPPRVALARLHGPDVDVLCRDKHEQEVKASRFQSNWRSGVVWLGAMLASGAVGYGLGLGFSALSGWLNAVGIIQDPSFAATLRKIFDPTLFAAVGLFTSSVSFFNDNVTGALRPITTRWVMSKSPEKMALDAKLKRELLHNAQVEQTVDARILAGRWTTTEMVTTLKQTLRQVSTELRSGNIEGAAAYLGGDLLASETLWFWVVPQSEAVFDLVRKPIAPYFRGVSDTDMAKLAEATLDYVRHNRQEVADKGRVALGDALTEYYAPMLRQLMRRDASAP
jgi:hypothetical protein